MKLITWNCNGGFRNKYHLLADNFDILIIQECENPDKSTKEYKEWSSNYLWKGNNKNKGIGIFFKENIDIKLLDWSDLNINYKNEELESFLPCMINNEYILINDVWIIKKIKTLKKI